MKPKTVEWMTGGDDDVPSVREGGSIAHDIAQKFVKGASHLTGKQGKDIKTEIRKWSQKTGDPARAERAKKVQLGTRSRQNKRGK